MLHTKTIPARLWVVVLLALAIATAGATLSSSPSYAQDAPTHTVRVYQIHTEAEAQVAWQKWAAAFYPEATVPTTWAPYVGAIAIEWSGENVLEVNACWERNLYYIGPAMEQMACNNGHLYIDGRTLPNVGLVLQMGRLQPTTNMVRGVLQIKGRGLVLSDWVYYNPDLYPGK